MLGRRAPTALGVVGSVRPTLKLLLDKVAAKSDMSFWDQVTKERRAWDEMLDKQADPARNMDRIHPQAVARAVSDLAKRDADFHARYRPEHVYGRPIGYARADRSGSSARFNNAAVGTRLVRQTVSKRSIGRAR